MATYYAFTLVADEDCDYIPANVEVTEYLVVSGDAEDLINADIAEDPEDFFNELVDDRFPGLCYGSHRRAYESEVPDGAFQIG